jgi:hypothetical protein
MFIKYIYCSKNMTGKILLPPQYDNNLEGNLVFLAGPIQGTWDWQSAAIQYFQKNAPELNIASPRRNDSSWKFNYNEQVDWETTHLNKAAQTGVILFWMAKETQHDCKRAYAQTTRFEFAEWKTKYQFDKNIKLAVGVEEGYTGAKYIQRRMSQDCTEITICNSLEETCRDAIRLVEK